MEANAGAASHPNRRLCRQVDDCHFASVGYPSAAADIHSAGWLDSGPYQPRTVVVHYRQIAARFVRLPALAGLQMLVSLIWSSFAAPLALNFALTVPNILIVNSAKIGPFYPWAQPMLLMTPTDGDGFGAYNVPLATLLTVVGGSAVLFILMGILYFRKRKFKMV